MKVIHIYPVDEENKHEIQSKLYPFCKCLPSEEINSETLIIKHNSFDGREGVELANEILYKYKY